MARNEFVRLGRPPWPDGSETVPAMRCSTDKEMPLLYTRRMRVYAAWYAAFFLFSLAITIPAFAEVKTVSIERESAHFNNKLSHRGSAEPAGIAPSAMRADIGEAQSFFVDPLLHRRAKSKVEATLRHIGKESYFYVEDGWWNALPAFEQQNTLARIASLAKEFDETIAPRMRALYGSEWIPGIENDPRVTIFLTELKSDTGGYFDSANEFSKSSISASNEREMVYLSALQLANSRMKAFLAHEFQHLISFNHKEHLRHASDDVWLNEARSESAPTLLGYDDTLQGSNLWFRMRSFLDDPTDPLAEWNNASADYGTVNIFAQYLRDQFGGRIFGDMLTSSRVSIASIEDALRMQGKSETFSQVFTSWSVANAVNSTASGTMYGYQNPHLRSLKVSPNATFPIGTSQFVYTSSMKSWSPRWYNYIPSGVEDGTLSLTFASPNTARTFKVPYVMRSGDGAFVVSEIPVASGRGTALIPRFGSSVKSVLVIPSLQERTDEFNTENYEHFELTAKVVNEEPFVLLSISPSRIFRAGVQTEITGSGFVEGMKVFFGEAASPKVTFTSGNSLQAEAPSRTPGTVSVRVVHPNGTSVTLPQQVTYEKLYPNGTLIRAQGDTNIYIVQGAYKRHIVSPKVFRMYGHLSFDKVVEVSPEVRDYYVTSTLIRTPDDKRVFEIRDGSVKRWINMTPAQFIASGRKWDMIYLVNNLEFAFYQTGAPLAAS